MTKSRISWLYEGDGNTSFFHTATLTRRKRNRIFNLKDESKNIMESPEEIKGYTINIFQNLFTTDHILTPQIRKYHGPTMDTLNLDHLTSLGLPLRDSKVILVVKSFKPIKALGPDSLHPLFYYKYWDIIGNKTIEFCKKMFMEAIFPSQCQRQPTPNALRTLDLLAYVTLSTRLSPKLLPIESRTFSLPSFVPVRPALFPKKGLRSCHCCPGNYLTLWEKER